MEKHDRRDIDVAPPPPPLEFQDEDKRSDIVESPIAVSKDITIRPSLSRGSSYQERDQDGGGDKVSVTSSTVSQTPSQVVTVNQNSPASMVTVTTTPFNQTPPPPPSVLEASAEHHLPNGLGSVNQVTVVTSHPPVLINDHQRDEVVILSNERTRTTHHHDHVADDTSSVGSSSRKAVTNAVKLDESEVLIVNSSNFLGEDEETPADDVEEDSLMVNTSLSIDDADNINRLVEEALNDLNRTTNSAFDTSHVSVVTVGEEQVRVKDSGSTPNGQRRRDQQQQQQVVNGGSSGAGDEESPADVNLIVNKQQLRGSGKDKRPSPDSSVASLDSASTAVAQPQATATNRRQQTPPQQQKQQAMPPVAVVVKDRSDADSIATSTSHDSREPPEEEKPVLRRPRSEQTEEERQLKMLQKKTRKRTRKFTIDGVQVTTTTSKVIYGDNENGKIYDDHLSRKQELRELKLLQKQEKKQFLDLQSKEQSSREQQERRFEQEHIALQRTYEADMDALSRQHRQLVEKTEQQQEADLRSASKKIRTEQERDLKQFRDSLKQELKLLKQEIDLLPKDRRKVEFPNRKAAMEADHEEKERSFLTSLSENHELALRRLSEKHRDRLATIDKNYLHQKQTTMRTREAMLWELEEKQIHEKHQLAKRHVKDMCFMQRHQMIIRHDKELDQIKRMLQRKEEDLVKRQVVEKRAFPKRIQKERKARDAMFRESLRISTNYDPDLEREKMKKVGGGFYLSDQQATLIEMEFCLFFSSSKSRRRRSICRSSSDSRRSTADSWRSCGPLRRELRGGRLERCTGKLLNSNESCFTGNWSSCRMKSARHCWSMRHKSCANVMTRCRGRFGSGRRSCCQGNR